MTTLALLLWPFLTLVLVLRRPFAEAVVISLIGGYLLLPTEGGVDFPVLPPFNKSTIPSLTLLVLGVLFCSGNASATARQPAGAPAPLSGWLPRSPLALIGLVLLVGGSMMTAITNADRLNYGALSLPGLRAYDGFSIALEGLTLLVPLLLGRKFLAHPEQHRLLLHGLVIAAICLSFLALYEIRMSPQLNRMVYGYFPHNWQQHVRNDGYRPVVFMKHGLQLAIFFAVSIIAAVGLYRAAPKPRKPLYLAAAVWLSATLFLSNSLGGLVVAMLIAPIVLFLTWRSQILIAAAIAGAILVYPMLRSLDLVPTSQLASAAALVSEDRAGSLKFRFNNEDLLLAHARERPLFGWGFYGRERVYNEWGADLTTIDGAWIAKLGETGWVGYVAGFGFLAVPILLLALRRKKLEARRETSVVALLVAAALIDLIPNGFMSPITLLAAGALWGRLELEATQPAVSERPSQDTSLDPPGPREVLAPRETPSYTRQTHLLTRRQPRKQG